MSEISCRLFEFFEWQAESLQVPVEELVEGTGLDLEQLRDPDAFVPWAGWARLCEATADRLGGEEAMVEAGRTTLGMSFWGPGQALGRALVHPAHLYIAVVRWLGPALFRALDFSVERPADTRLRIMVRQPSATPPCRSWFLMALGAFERMPCIQGLEDAHIRFSQDGHLGTYEIAVPASRSVAARARRRFEAFAGADRMVEELGALTDEVRQAYQTARASEALLRGVLDALPDPVAVRVDGRVAFENPSWRAIFGETPVSGLLPEPLQPHAEVFSGAPRAEADVVVDLPSGRRVFSCPPSAPVQWGALSGQLLVLRDVTAARQAAEARELADRLRSLGTVAAGVGHEINTPLAYALGELEVLEGRAIEGGITPGELRSGLSTLREALLRVRDISRDLLAFGRPPKGVEPTDVRAAVDTALRLAGAQLKHSVHLRVDLPETPMVVAGRSGELAQVFLNLVLNARDAMADLPVPRRRLLVRGRTEGEQHVLSVADSGPGVPADQRARLFEPWFTTKGDGGTGLGLAVCAKILREHGGSIEILDGPGGVFAVRLPVLHADLPEVWQAPAPPPVLRRLRVLVVDDQVRFATLLPRLLPRHSVIFEQTGEAALSRLAAGEHFDVLLCDVMMPGMDGPTLHRRLVAEWPELARRTLFVTGGAFEGGARAYLQSAGQPVLQKPYERRALVRAIEEAVAAAGPDR